MINKIKVNLNIEIITCKIEIILTNPSAVREDLDRIILDNNSVIDTHGLSILTSKIIAINFLKILPLTDILILAQELIILIMQKML